MYFSFAGQLSSFCEDMREIHREAAKLFQKCFSEDSKRVAQPIMFVFCEVNATELFSSKVGGQTLQIYKILNFLHICIYFGYLCFF